MVEQRGITQSSVEWILGDQYSNDTQEFTVSPCVFALIWPDFPTNVACNLRGSRSSLVNHVRVASVHIQAHPISGQRLKNTSYHILFRQCLSPCIQKIHFSPVRHLQGGSIRLSVGHISLGQRTCIIDPLLLVQRQQEPQPTGIRLRRFRTPLRHILVHRQPSSLSIMKRQTCANGHSRYVSPLRLADHREP